VEIISSSNNNGGQEREHTLSHDCASVVPLQRSPQAVF
jgi:hypothetical protein